MFENRELWCVEHWEPFPGVWQVIAIFFCGYFWHVILLSRWLLSRFRCSSFIRFKLPCHEFWLRHVKTMSYLFIAELRNEKNNVCWKNTWCLPRKFKRILDKKFAWTCWTIWQNTSKLVVSQVLVVSQSSLTSWNVVALVICRGLKPPHELNSVDRYIYPEP